MSKKIAVILFNLGGPDSKESIGPFLMNFFMDRNIIDLPKFSRYLLAKYISIKRSKCESRKAYKELGDKSPLLENSRAQGKFLEEILNIRGDNQYKIFVSMRYWHPMAPQIAKEVQEWGAEKLILLPLYPQFSTTTTWSSLENWNKILDEMDYHPETSAICCYPFNKGFVETSAENIVKQYEQAISDGHVSPRILFSAHGLPEKIINGGDPYQWQCEQSAEKIVSRLKEKLGLEFIDWQICYQSRVGRLKWIGPSIDEALEKAAIDNKPVIIYPHAFTQEHVETLVELDIEYKLIAIKKGVPAYYRASTVGIKRAFIEGLVILIRDHMDKEGVYAEGGKSICPEIFGRCCMRFTGS